MEAYSSVIKGRKTATDSRQEHVKQSVATPSLESAGDATTSRVGRRQAAADVESSTVGQASSGAMSVGSVWWKETASGAIGGNGR